MRQRTPIDDAAAEIALRAAERMEAANGSPAVVKITETISTLRQAEIDLSERFLALQAELPAHRAGLGETALDSVLSPGETTPGDTVPGLDSLAAVNAEGEVLLAAIDAARNRRREALGGRAGAIAQVLRDGELATLQAEATGHNRKAQKAVTALEKLEGCRYIPAITAASPGTYVDDYSGLIPRSAIYRVQVEALEAEVAQAQAVRISDSGTLTGRSREGIIQAALDVAPDTLGPSIPDVLAWLDATEPEVLARQQQLQGIEHGGVDLFYYLIFDGGKVDSARSKIIIPSADHLEAEALNVRPLAEVAR